MCRYLQDNRAQLFPNISYFLVKRHQPTPLVRMRTHTKNHEYDDPNLFSNSSSKMLWIYFPFHESFFPSYIKIACRQFIKLYAESLNILLNFTKVTLKSPHLHFSPFWLNKAKPFKHYKASTNGKKYFQTHLSMIL